MNDQQKKPKTESTPFYKATTIIGIVICVLLVPILVINCTLIVKSFVNKDEIPDFFGYVPFMVESNSMDPEIKEGDLIIVKKLSSDELDKIETGNQGDKWSDECDVITFFDVAMGPDAVTTHRAMYRVYNEDGSFAGFKTAGDFNVWVEGFDEYEETNFDKKVVAPDKVIGEYTGIRIPFMGKVAMFMQTTGGLITCVVVPLVLLIGYDIIRRRLYDSKNKKKDEGKEKDIDALMAELEALKAAKAAEEAKTAEAAPEVVEEAAPEVTEPVTEAVADTPEAPEENGEAKE